MSIARRLAVAAKAVVQDPVERRSYVSRLKFLARGTEGIEAWGLEYRSGLTGQFAVPLERFASEAEQIWHCPEDCPSGAPMSHLYRHRHTYLLPNTVAHTANGGTLAANNEGTVFFVRESIAWPYESVLVHGLDVPDLSSVEYQEDHPAVVFPTTRNYYHWIVEDLPLVLRAHQVAPDALLMAYGPGLTKRHQSVATSLGMAIVEAPLVVRLRQQVLPGRADDSFFIHPTDLSNLRAFGCSLAATSEPARSRYPDRVYVSRRHARRSLANEALLESLLSACGFEVVHAETLPWLEQIRIFQHAKIVVGPHGAGLANLAFADPGTQVLELTTGFHYNRAFEWLCHIGSMEYREIQVDATSLPAERLARQINLQCDEAFG